MDINGIWKGEYFTQVFMFQTGKEVKVPFVMRLRTTDERKIITIDKGLFEGVCQDDPEVTKINLHATIRGSFNIYDLYFVKQYPKLLIRKGSGDIEAYDDLHPEIHYSGRFNDKNEFRGTWSMSRTFRTINGNLCELGAMSGAFWMKKFTPDL